MADIIIYETAEGGVSIVYPAPNKSATAIAPSDVPTGLNYWIRDDADLPPSDVFDSAREPDLTILGLPDGQGAN